MLELPDSQQHHEQPWLIRRRNLFLMTLAKGLAKVDCGQLQLFLANDGETMTCKESGLS